MENENKSFEQLWQGICVPREGCLPPECRVVADPCQAGVILTGANNRSHGKFRHPLGIELG